jgi:hypothetical protein
MFPMPKNILIIEDNPDDAFFSHSLCPDCVKKLYPDFDEEDM